MFTSQVTHKLHFLKLSTEDTLTLLWNQWNKPLTVLPISVIESYAKVSRNGDLLGPCYVETVLPAQTSGELWVNRVGFRLLKQVELRIGGQMIDRHYSLWMHVWTELTYTSAQKSILGRIVGQKAVDGTLAD